MIKRHLMQKQEGTIIRGTMPFLYMDLINIALLIAFPAIALWLPSTMQL
ncbi:hypothetical protein ACFLRP_01360 [Bacteroidota bacterium]